MSLASPAIDTVFAALGDPTRRAIVERLAASEATMSEVAAPFAMSLSAVHQHIALLEGAGIVACEKRGRERWCRLDPRGLERVERWVGERRRLWERRLDALQLYLASGTAGTKTKKKRKRP
ncbi:MAG: metalloregulator ArsR/SmtB family transcription factor [Alphaproteobacteria bacterium]|nr:metalloregulator ArsR/SmtB family transcription factor [Alphaproteobacteria bacterium]